MKYLLSLLSISLFFSCTITEPYEHNSTQANENGCIAQESKSYLLPIYDKKGYKTDKCQMTSYIECDYGYSGVFKTKDVKEIVFCEEIDGEFSLAK